MQKIKDVEIKINFDDEVIEEGLPNIDTAMDILADGIRSVFNCEPDAHLAEDKQAEYHIGDYVGIPLDDFLIPCKIINVNDKTFSIAPLKFSLDGGEANEDGVDFNNVKTYEYVQDGEYKSLDDLELVALD